MPNNTSNGLPVNQPADGPRPRARNLILFFLFLGIGVTCVLIFAMQSASKNAAMTEATPDGALVYQRQCAVCHQDDGKGVKDTYPPLLKTEYVNGDPETIASIVLHGMQGPITVLGVKYNGLMPAKKEVITAAEVAAVINHVRTAFGNADAHTAPITTAQVEKVLAATANRNEPWRADELVKDRR